MIYDSVIWLLIVINNSNFVVIMFVLVVVDFVWEFVIIDLIVLVFIVLVYMLGFVVGFLLVVLILELYGCFWIYNICNLCFLVMNIGCVVVLNLGGFLVCCFFVGVVGFVFVIIGGGIIVDVIILESRVKVMLGFVFGFLFGLVSLLYCIIVLFVNGCW